MLLLKYFVLDGIFLICLPVKSLIIPSQKPLNFQGFFKYGQSKKLPAIQYTASFR